MLVVFGGRPGTGKTTLARLVAQHLGATFVRIDSIEVAIGRSGLAVGAVGYVVGNAVVRDQLVLSRPVVVDAVNPVAVARQGWADLAASFAVPCRFVEVVCSDPAEHRRRVETRTADIEEHVLPTWDQIMSAEYEPWREERFVVDNVGPAAHHVAAILDYLR
jgi:predicted kinase